MILEHSPHRSIFAASKVCTYWRATAIGHTSFWSTIWVSSPGSHDVARDLLATWQARLVPGRPDLALHTVDGVAAALDRSHTKSITIYVSLVGPRSPAWETALREVLAPRTARIAALHVLYQHSASLRSLPMLDRTAGPSPALVKLLLDHCEDAALLEAGIDGEGELHGAKRLFATAGHAARFPALARCRTSIFVYWKGARADSCPALTSLEMCATRTEDVFAAVRACPRLERLRVHVEDDLRECAYPEPALVARVRGIADVTISGPCVNDGCDGAGSLAEALSYDAPRRAFRIDCAEFWPGVGALFVGLQDLSQFSHDVAEGVHTVSARNDQGHERVLTAPEEGNDAEAWRDFYGHLRDTLAPLPAEDVSVPAQYGVLIVP